ncbi:MAG TPA: thiamine-phosphate kinase, partial [Beijerinckiaceae bacterium]
DAARYACPLIGGDTVRTPGPLTLSITALGSTPAGRMVPRGGARPGDALYVSGTIGDAALGLRVRAGTADWGAALDAAARAHLLARYLTPEPRHALRHAVRAHARAAMDVSDGLVGDLAKMMRAAGVAARVELARTPFSPAARQAIALDAGAFETAVTGGDDYELLCAVAPEASAAFEAEARAAGVPVTRIGVVEAGQGDVLLGVDGRPRAFARGSFSHF